MILLRLMLRGSSAVEELKLRRHLDLLLETWKIGSVDFPLQAKIDSVKLASDV